MSKVKLPQKFIDRLIELPEDGMGYQIVYVTLIGGVVLDSREIVNSEYLLLLDKELIETEDIIDVISMYHE